LGRGEHRTFHPLRGDGLEADLVVVTGAVKELYNVPGAESTDSTNMVTLLRIKPDPESLDRVGAYMKSRHQRRSALTAHHSSPAIRSAIRKPKAARRAAI
jgi:hypothetical protein